MIKAEDLKVDVFRTGVLGQDVAVRITHLPTGKVAESGLERSELRAKARALCLMQDALGLPEGEPDAEAVTAESLLRLWFRWWNESGAIPATPPDNLHVQTAAFLAATAVRQGRTIRHPRELWEETP